MTIKRTVPAPLAELLQSQQDEIGKHKWIESEKAGHDIGWARAGEDWFNNHMADWLRHQREVVDQVLLTEELLPEAPRSVRATPLPSARPGARRQKRRFEENCPAVRYGRGE